MSTGLRARRWDVLVLGSALPGLVAAIRLAMAGQRVLVVEEERAARLQGLLREPFALPGPAADNVLDPILRALGFAPIDRRAFETDPVAFQVVLPDARVEIGEAAATAQELVSWRLAKPEASWDLVRSLALAGRAELEAMLSAPVVRRSGLRGLSRRRPPRLGTSALQPASREPSGGHGPSRGTARGGLARGLPEPAAAAPAPLARVLEATVRGLSNLAAAEPSPEARARLLGGPLVGGGAFHAEGVLLHDLLRRRLEEMHGEFRTLGGPFEFVRVGDDPGIARVGPGDAWLGRVLVLNAPAARIAGALRGWQRPAPAFLAGPPVTHRRLAVHLRALAEVVPEGMARRAILVSDATAPARDTNAITLARHASSRGRRFVELVASAVVPDEPARLEETAHLLEEAVTRLMPFCEGRVARAPLPALPLWDDDAALCDPEPQEGWPCEVSMHGAGRWPVFVLRREALAGLGAEGDLLLGWRAGDAIRQELS
jgi:hypothetical protein